MAESALERIEKPPLKKRLCAVLESPGKGLPQKRFERALFAHPPGILSSGFAKDVPRSRRGDAARCPTRGERL
jgi:hypothetical protein